MHIPTWFWIVGFVVVSLILAYAVLIRPIVVNAPLLSAAFKEEATLWDKLTVWLSGWKTKIAARFVMLSGMLVGAYDQLLPLATGQDWTPLTSKIPAWTLPVGMVALGWLFSYLRKVTENPSIVVTQRNDDGDTHVVAVVKPATVAPPSALPPDTLPTNPPAAA